MSAPMIRPAQLDQLPYLDATQKQNYKHGLAQLWQHYESSPEGSPQKIEAKNKIVAASSKIMMQLNQKGKPNTVAGQPRPPTQAGAQAGQASNAQAGNQAPQGAQQPQPAPQADANLALQQKVSRYIQGFQVYPDPNKHRDGAAFEQYKTTFKQQLGTAILKSERAKVSLQQLQVHIQQMTNIGQPASEEMRSRQQVTQRALETTEVQVKALRAQNDQNKAAYEARHPPQNQAQPSVQASGNQQQAGAAAQNMQRQGSSSGQVNAGQSDANTQQQQMTASPQQPQGAAQKPQAQPPRPVTQSTPVQPPQQQQQSMPQQQQQQTQQQPAQQMQQPGQPPQQPQAQQPQQPQQQQQMPQTHTQQSHPPSTTQQAPHSATHPHPQQQQQTFQQHNAMQQPPQRPPLNVQPPQQPQYPQQYQQNTPNSALPPNSAAQQSQRPQALSQRDAMAQAAQSYTQQQQQQAQQQGQPPNAQQGMHQHPNMPNGLPFSNQPHSATPHTPPNGFPQTQQVSSISGKPSVTKNLVLGPQTQTPVSGPPSRPTMMGQGGMMNVPGIQKPPPFTLEGEGDHVLSKRKLDELVRQITGSTNPADGLTPEVEEAVLTLTDDFVDNVISKACQLAKLRQGQTLDIRDVQMVLERNYGIRIPGYSLDEVRTVRKFQPAPGWVGKVQAVQAAKVMGGNKDA